VPAAADDLSGSVALVTGGGRGIGFRIARELIDAGARVGIASRSRDQLERASRELGAFAVAGDVSREEDVARMVEETERELGPIDLLVANAGINGRRGTTVELSPAEWWYVFEVNVLGTHLCCRAVLPSMYQRGGGRIVIVGSGSAFLPIVPDLPLGHYAASKAAVGRFAESLAAEAASQSVAVFLISPGFVQTQMTAEFPADSPWTPPELAPRLIRVLASGRADRLAGRYIHAEQDDIEDLIRRADEVVAQDLNAIRLRR